MIPKGTGRNRIKEGGFLVMIPAVALVFFPWVANPFGLKQEFAPLLLSAALLYWLYRGGVATVRSFAPSLSLRAALLFGACAAASNLTAQNAPEAFEATMNSLGYEYQSDFARRYFGQGKAEGRMEIILKLLALRFGPLPDATETRVRSVQDAQLDALAERMLTATTLEEAVRQLF